MPGSPHVYQFGELKNAHKHFPSVSEQREAGAKGGGSFSAPQQPELAPIQLARSPHACGSMQNRSQKFLLHWILSRPMQCVQGSQNTLSREKKEGLLLGMAQSTFGRHPRQLSLIKSAFPSSRKPAAQNHTYRALRIVEHSKNILYLACMQCEGLAAPFRSQSQGA